MRLAVHWALMSKEVLDTRDYRVLDCSSGLATMSEFGPAIRDLGVGDLPDQFGPSDAAPWVTIGPYTFSGAPHVGLVIREPAGIRDRANRSITDMRYFCLPRAVMAEHGISLRAFYDAVNPHHELPSNGAPITINVAAATVHDAIERVEADSHLFLGAMAATLLESKIALINPGDVPVEERLDRIDAILSLLPAGLRLNATVSTWMRTQRAEHVWIGFTTRAPSTHIGVSWGSLEAPQGEPRGLTAQYFERLTRISQRIGPEPLLTALAADQTLLTLTDGEQVLASLDALWWPLAALEGLRTGTVTLSQVVELLVSGILQQLPNAERELALRLVLEQGSVEHLALLRDRRIAVLPELVATELAAHFEHQGPLDRERLLLELAQLSGGYFHVLALLIRSHQGNPDVARSIVRLLEQDAAALQRVGGDGEEHWVRRALLGQPALLYLLLQQATTGGLAAGRGWVSWLVQGTTDPPQVLRAWIVALDLNEMVKLEPADIAAVAEVDEQYVACLLTLSGQAGSFIRMLIAIWPYLVPILSASEADGSPARRTGLSRAAWGEEIERAASMLMEPPSLSRRVATDILLLLARSEPYPGWGGAALRTSSGEADAYIAALARQLASPSLEPAMFGAILAGLRTWAERLGLRRDALTRNLVALVEQLHAAAPHLDQVRETALLELLVAVIEAATPGKDDISESLTSWLATQPQYQPALLRMRLRWELTALKPSADSAAQLAVLLVDLSREAAVPEIVAGVLGGPAGQRPHWVEVFLVYLQELLCRHNRRTAAECEEVLSRIRLGLVHSPTGAAYRNYVLSTGPVRLRGQLNVLQALRDDLSEEDQALLDSITPGPRGESRTSQIASKVGDFLRNPLR